MKKLFDYTVYEYDTLESTNTLLFERGKEGEKDKTVIVARYQTGGRGRRGKSFFSPEGTGVYMSILTRKAISLDKLSYLTPAVAVAVSRAIEGISDKKCDIKWVNDIFIDSKKVAGILTETKCDFEKGRLDFAVIGIGVNLFKPTNDFPDEIKNIATSVFDERNEELRSKLIEKIIFEFDLVLENFDPDSFMDEYRSKSLLDGKKIVIISDGEEKEATALYIDRLARLVVKTKEGEIALSSGEVSIRL